MVKNKHDRSVEYVAKVLEGLVEEVQWTTEKDIEIDIIARFKNEDGIKIVVRTVSPESQYTWIGQTKFDIYDEKLFMAVLYEKGLNSKEIYLLPATEWQNIDGPFKTKNYDKPGQVSKPEYGITFSGIGIEKISHLSLPIILAKLKKEEIKYNFASDEFIDRITSLNKCINLQMFEMNNKAIKAMKSITRQFKELEPERLKLTEALENLSEKAMMVNEGTSKNMNLISKQLEQFGKIEFPKIRFDEIFNDLIENINKGLKQSEISIGHYKGFCFMLGYPPHNDISIPEIRGIVDLYNSLNGDLQKIKPIVDSFYIEKFDDVYIRDKFFGKWTNSGLLNNRSNIIEESLICFEQELYFAAIPLMFSQLEGLIADKNRHEGSMNGREFKKYMDKLFNSKSSFSYDDELFNFFSNVLIVGFGHQEELKSFLSRHAIIHGGDVEYGTKENYIKLILFFDSVHDKLVQQQGSS